MTHLAVPKTYKLYVGGAFPRSESGRTYAVRDAVERAPLQRRQHADQRLTNAPLQ